MDIGGIFIDALRAAIGPVAAAYAVSAIGLNLQFGYTGLLNFGHVGFMMVGAYGMAITVDFGGSLWLGILVGILAAVVLGLILGVPTLRLRADYLAIVTISAAEILRLLVRSSWATHSPAASLESKALPMPSSNSIPSTPGRPMELGTLRSADASCG